MARNVYVVSIADDSFDQNHIETMNVAAENADTALDGVQTLLLEGEQITGWANVGVEGVDCDICSVTGGIKYRNPEERTPA